MTAPRSRKSTSNRMVGIIRMWQVALVLLVALTGCVGAQKIGGSSPIAKALIKGAEAKFTIKVVDDDGLPVPDASVQMGFMMEGQDWKRGRTDTNGLFSASGKSRGEMTYNIKKEGYYDTRKPPPHRFTDTMYVENGKWMPWDSVITSVLRRVVSPIPMHAKRVRTVIPILDEYVGYDLKRGDWVAPFGDGAITDIRFRMTKRYESIWNFDSSLEVSIPGKKNGLIETSLEDYGFSDFKFARNAPTHGYSVQYMELMESSTNYFSPNRYLSYFFRVRSVVNEAEEIASAYYGNIRSHIGYDVRRHETGVILFTYYFNPTPNDRNMEFDPERNLFDNLPFREAVRDP